MTVNKILTHNERVT